MTSRSSDIRVGTVLLAALAVMALSVFLVGDKSNLFRRKSDYFVRFRTVGGLNEGNPVQLNGVNVGTVKRIVLPEDVRLTQLSVHIAIDQRYSSRVRTDSVARIRTLGLLGDKYVDITSGSADQPEVPVGGEIRAAPATDVEKLITSGEDVVNNVVAISHSLNRILKRVDAGEGLIGELTSDPETGRKVTESVLATMESIQNLTRQVETGEGPLGRLINDQQLGAQMAAAVDHLEALLDRAESGDGLLPSLLNEPATRVAFDETLASLRAAAVDLAKLTGRFETADGIVPRLLTDQVLADELLLRLESLLGHLGSVVEKIDRGDGTAGQLVNDPAVHDAVQDVVIGVNESRLLRWLIRNRQKKGIEKRYEEARTTGDDSDAEATELSPDVPPGGGTVP